MLEKFKDKLKNLSKNKIILCVVIGIIVILGITSFCILKSFKKDTIVENYKDVEVKDKEIKYSNDETEDKVDDILEEDENIEEDVIDTETKINNLLDGYSKTVNINEPVEEDYKIDTNHIIIGEETMSDTELTKKYNVIINGITKDLVVNYKVESNKILYKMTLNGEIVDEETIEFDEEYAITLEKFKEDLEFIIFKPEYLTFLKGNDGKEYVILEKHSFSNKYHIDGYILNSDFYKMTVNLNGVEVNSFEILNGEGEALNLDEYSEEIGFKTKKKIMSYDINRFLAAIDGKIKYFDVKLYELESSDPCDIQNRGYATLYEFSFENNELIANKINGHEIFWVTQQIC